MRNRLSVIIAVFACVVFSIFFFSTPQKAQVIIPIIVGNGSSTVVAGACLPPGQGGNPANCSLYGAIQQAEAGSSNSIIHFAIPPSDPSCSAGVCTINLTGSLPVITEPLSIVGPGANKLVVRPATGISTNVFGVVTADDETVSISGLSIIDGISSAGGGIFHGGGILNVTSCRISNNLANGNVLGGGGIANVAGTVNIINSTISHNIAGGSANTGGGGIYNQSGTVNVINSTISNNHSTTAGGVTGGGGIMNNGGIINVTNSTITRNTSPGLEAYGGGIFQVGGTAFVRSSIIAVNAATTNGQDAFGSFTTQSFNLIGKRDGSSGFTIDPSDLTGTNASPLNPLLDPAGLQNNGGPTRTIALRPGSPAIDQGIRIGLTTGTLSTDQRGATYMRSFNNPAIPNSFGSDGADIGAFELQSKSPFDFDDDNKTDIGIFRPPVGEWWYLRSSNGQVPAFQFGASSDKIVPADFTGDGKTDVAVYRPVTGEWFILRSENFSYYSFPFGAAGDIPMPADYDADGKADAAVFRPSNGLWVINRSSDQGNTILPFGQNGDVPVAADYDGDGRADVAIWRPSAGEWWLLRSTAGVIGFGFGSSTDKPVHGDYTGDGKADIAIWRPATGEWFILRSENLSYFSVPFGIAPDIPAPGDYDGDGKFDTTVFRPSTGFWHIQRSTAGTLSVPFGQNGDRPIPSAFAP